MMVKRLKKPKPTLETSLILRFGLKFIGLSEEDPEDKMLFDAFIRAYGLVQKGFYFFVIHQKFRVPTGDEIKKLTDAVEPYRNDPEACAYLRETYKRLREMVYVATAESSGNPVELSKWIGENMPRMDYGKDFWSSPGSTKWGGNKKYYWQDDARFTSSQRNMLSLFGLFRCDFIETLGLSLHAHGSLHKIFTKNVFILKNRSKWLYTKSKRRWSNGEFYFAACPYCKVVFAKNKCWDKTFCSTECATYYARQFKRKHCLVNLLLIHLWYVGSFQPRSL
jgi:hypothetical protein